MAAIDRALASLMNEKRATQKGWMLLESGDLPRAEVVLLNTIRRFPDELSARTLLTQVYKKWKRWDDGAATAERACAADPNNFDMRESWAGCLLAADRPREAMTVIEDGLKLFDAVPAVFQLLMQKAEAHQQLGNVDDAIDAIAKAVALQPASTLAPNEKFATHKGWMLLESGDLPRAEAVLRDTIQHFPDSLSAHALLMQVYKKWERWDDGAAAAERACAVDLKNFDMRTSWADCLLASQRPCQAIAVIEDGLKLFDAVPAAFHLLMRKAEAHQQLGNLDDAIDAIGNAVALRPDSEAAIEKLCLLRALQAEGLLAREDYTGAECRLRGVLDDFPDHADLWGLLATANWGMGQREAAMAAIDRALALAPNENFATRKSWMLLESSDLPRAEEVLLDAIRRFPDGLSAHALLTQVYKKWERWDDGAAAAERACAADPKNFDMRESWASCLLDAQRPREAMAIIADGLKLFDAVPAVFQLMMQKAEAFVQLGNVDDAVDVLGEAIALRPDDEAALEQICSLTLTSGRRDKGDLYRRRLHEVQAEQLPDRLADGLAMIWDRVSNITLDEQAVEWAWELADKSAWNKAEWRAAAAWGKEASLLLRRWWETVPTERLRQLDELVDQPNLSEFHAASVQRGACFMVSAHVGPTAAAVHILSMGNRPFSTVGSPDRGRLYDEAFIPTTRNSVTSMRKVVGKIKGEATIGIMADAVGARDCLAIEFLGRQIELPPQVPKLLRKFNAPSFWCCPLWRNGRITIELERLPDPSEGEPGDEWCSRWFAAYLQKLEAVMRGRPENLKLYSGIWANVNRTAIQKRQKRRER